MSYSMGAENKTVLDLFAYYNQLHEWKYKVKRRVKSRTSSPKSAKSTEVIYREESSLQTSTEVKYRDKSKNRKSPDDRMARKQVTKERSIKRRFRKNVVKNNNNYDEDDEVFEESARNRRCKSMIELGDGIQSRISFYERGGDCDEKPRKSRKPVQRSVSMKERILERAGNFDSEVFSRRNWNKANF